MSISQQISELIGVNEPEVLEAVRHLPFKQYNELSAALNVKDVASINSLLGFGNIMEDMGQLQAGKSINYIDKTDDSMNSALVKNPSMNGNAVELEIDGETVVKNMDDIEVPDEDELDKLLQMANLSGGSQIDGQLTEYKGDDPAKHKSYILRQSELLKKINSNTASQEEMDEYNANSAANTERSAVDTFGNDEINQLVRLSR